MAQVLAADAVAELGEGPLWAGDRLYWFDIEGRRLFASSETGTVVSWEMGEQATAAGRLADGRLLIATETGLFRFDPASGGREPIVALEANDPTTRSNDGRADRQGGFWIGTMGKGEHSFEKGALYRYHGGRMHRLRGGVAVPNAIAFAPDGRRGYFADSRRQQVFTWPLDAEGWPAGEAVLFLDLSGTGDSPDGAVVDSEGALWIALWDGGRVVRVSPDGRPGAEIALPVARPTCPAFGADLRRLYVTTARIGLDAEAIAAQPLAGCVFAAGIDVPGLPEPVVAA